MRTAFFHRQLKAFFAAIFLALLSLTLLSCNQRLKGNPASNQPWSIGFWMWAGGEPAAFSSDNMPLDALYIQVGRVDSYFKNSVSWKWQANLPPSKEYWTVWRYDPPAIPSETQISILAGDFIKRRSEAAACGKKLIGLQLDYDCPTDDLKEYGSFIEKLRQALPPGTKISITALLDWFRSGTKIKDALEHVNEFTPQFYDVSPRSQGKTRSIAEPIDAARWGPIFNSYGIPYRIGITTFGRIVYLHSGTAEEARDLTPLDVLDMPGLETMENGQTPAGEQRFVMRVKQSAKLSYYSRIGDQIELIRPTQNSVLAAYNQARLIGGACAGVIFFRWPNERESLVLDPMQVMGWLNHREAMPANPKIEVREGDCAAVQCSDLQLSIPTRFPERKVVYRISSSQPFEYFLPNPRIKSRIRQAGASAIRIELPALHGTGSLRLGRAVTGKAAQFTIDQEK
jgi:hypothetical protein